MALGFSFFLSLHFHLPSLPLRWHPRSWQAACPAGRCAPRGHTSSPRQSGARLRSRPRPWRKPRHRRQRCSRKWPCTVSEEESIGETCWSVDMVLLLYRSVKSFYPTTGRRGSSSLAHWFRSSITVVVLGTGRWLITSWKQSKCPSEISLFLIFSLESVHKSKTALVILELKTSKTILGIEMIFFYLSLICRVIFYILMVIKWLICCWKGGPV